MRRRRKLSGSDKRDVLRRKVRSIWGSRWNNIPISNLRIDQMYEAIKEAVHIKAEEAAAPPGRQDDRQAGIGYLDPQICRGPVPLEVRDVLEALIAEETRKAWRRIWPDDSR